MSIENGKRVYKSKISHEKVFNIITKGDGVTVPEHFCEDVLETFIQINDVFDDIFKEHSD